MTVAGEEAERVRFGPFVDEKAVFADPVAYLRNLGIEAELVDTAAGLVPAA